MKWKNPGHELDEVFKNIETKKQWYLFGAGDYGRQFLAVMKDEISIAGFIDNDIEKCQKGCGGYSCRSLSSLQQLPKTTGIILTISQFARSSALVQLKALGLEKEKDFYVFEEFLSVYFVYKYEKVYLSSISFLPSTVCNLKCRHCLNFNPFAKQFYQRKLEDLKEDLDLFFQKVDRLMLFHLSGGEPMLYPDVAELIRYISENYGNRIDTFRTVTNGTVIPKEEVLRALADTQVEVTIDDYREAVPRFCDTFEELVGTFDKYGVNYVLNKAESWIDLAPERTDFTGMSEKWLEQHFTKCSQTWQELRDGKLYMCNYAAYAMVAGISDGQEKEETYDLSGDTSEWKKELVEFRLGYSKKGYTAFCKKCRGFTEENGEEVVPAIQVEKR